MTLKLSLLAAATVLDIAAWLASQIGDVNVILNVVTILVALAVAYPIIRSRRKDMTIADLEKALDARNERLTETQEALEGASVRADAAEATKQKLREEIAGLEGEMRHLKLYAAPQAFESIAAELASVRTTMSESISAQGELVLKTTELQSKSLEALHLISRDLSRMAERLGAGGDRPLQP